jgi:hypothetical protein
MYCKGNYHYAVFVLLLAGTEAIDKGGLKKMIYDYECY